MRCRGRAWAGGNASTQSVAAAERAGARSHAARRPQTRFGCAGILEDNDFLDCVFSGLSFLQMAAWCSRENRFKRAGDEDEEEDMPRSVRPAMPTQVCAGCQVPNPACKK